MNNSSKLKNKIAKLPDAPGVYIFKDAQGGIIYIGKAKSLKKRVNNYLGRDLSDKTVALMSAVNDLEYRLTPTESLALLLEQSLIHKHKPKYNVSLRDDKSFPMVKITNEDFPAICITRKRQFDGSRYFGPYTSAHMLRQALKIIRRYFPYRSCRELPQEACMYYQLGLSPAPCIGKISRKEYAQTVENITWLLEGRNEALVEKLSRLMEERAEKKEYEEAAKIRDQIAALGTLSQSPCAQGGIEELESLQKLLHLKHLPQRIEAFDISNIFGKEATGSMVSFYRGFPDKDNYRRFRIKTVEGINDYSMLAEVIRRRYLRLSEEKLPLPDLVLIDGGRAHLSVAWREVKRIGLSLALASIAKEKENIYSLNNTKPINLKSDTPALNLIRRIRDEAHRFAVSYHHVLRRKKLIGR